MPKEFTSLKPGQMMPDFSLPSASGRPIRISDYRNRSNLVVIFVPSARLPELEDLIHTFQRLEAELAEQQAQLLLVLPGSPETAKRIKSVSGFPFPILADEQNLSARYAQPQPTGKQIASVVYVLDRFGEIYAVQPLEQPAPATEILDWLRFIELQCPE